MCIVANKQTEGRGRLGRTWVSEKDSGLYFSIVLRPDIETKFLSLITLMTAVVVFEVLQDLYKLKPDIKWSNDVIVNDRKISGILAESIETTDGLAVIVGIGINLNTKFLPEGLSKTATSIEEESNQKPNQEELLNSLTKFFKYFYEILKSQNGAELIRKEWAKRSSYYNGKDVRATLVNQVIYGKTCGLEENGALRIKLKNGDIKIIQAGDVERLRKN